MTTDGERWDELCQALGFELREEVMGRLTLTRWTREDGGLLVRGYGPSGQHAGRIAVEMRAALDCGLVALQRDERVREEGGVVPQTRLLPVGELGLGEQWVVSAMDAGRARGVLERVAPRLSAIEGRLQLADRAVDFTFVKVPKKKAMAAMIDALKGIAEEAQVALEVLGEPAWVDEVMACFEALAKPSDTVDRRAREWKGRRKSYRFVARAMLNPDTGKPRMSLQVELDEAAGSHLRLAPPEIARMTSMDGMPGAFMLICGVTFVKTEDAAIDERFCLETRLPTSAALAVLTPGVKALVLSLPSSVESVTVEGRTASVECRRLPKQGELRKLITLLPRLSRELPAPKPVAAATPNRVWLVAALLVAAIVAFAVFAAQNARP